MHSVDLDAIFIFDPYEYHMDLCNEPCSFGWLAIFHTKNIGHYMQTVQPIFFIPAMLFGTIDFYQYIPLSPRLTFPGVTRSVQNKTYWLHFFANFRLIRKKFVVVMKQLELDILILFLSKIYGNKGNNCCFTGCIKQIYCWHVFGCLLMDLIKT